MTFKFLHVQSHFIHLYFLTVFEVLFYIYYVMPYEKSIFKHMFDKDIPQFDDAIFANITYLFSAENCDKYQTELDNANVHLWKYCFIYIEIVTSVLFAFFLRDLYKIRQGYKLINPSPRHNSHSSLVSFGSFPNLSEYKKTDDSIEITNLSSPKDDNKMVPIENETIYKYYWYNSGFLSEFIKTAEFIILVGIFEYFFFVSIVDKYKIANSKTILCDILKKAS